MRLFKFSLTHFFAASTFTSAILFFAFSAMAQQKSNGTTEMFGEFALHSNYVDKGLTQSDKTIAVLTGLGYQFGNTGKIGLSANSVKYTTDGATMEVGLFGEFKFIFTANADLTFRNDWIRYFSENNRDKVEVQIDQNFFGYHVLIFREDNFEGTKRPRNWFAFHKDWNFSANIQFNTTAGYSMVENFDNFFDTRVGVTYLLDKVSFAAVTTYVSPDAQFGTRAETAYFAIISAKF